MYRRDSLLALLIAASTTLSHAEESAPAAKTYRNPILEGGADPDVLEVDGTYYLYPTYRTSGYDVWVSKNLVDWNHEGRVFNDPRGGAWAPDVFRDRNDGKCYVYYTDDDPADPDSPLGKQIGVAVSDSPLGPFKDRGVLATGAIDAHMFQDDDGKLFLYYVEVRGGFKIFVQPMKDPVTKEGDRIEVLHPTEKWEMVSGQVTEGPFILKRDGTYYLMYSGTGADSPNYGIGYATSKSPTGPFTKYEGNPIVHRGEGIFGPGHHCVVTGPDKKLWMVYHQKYNDGQNYSRFVAIDPLWFDDKGVIHAKVSRDSDQPGPIKGE
jgi:xylan 1,4-beta-xylosidase